MNIFSFIKKKNDNAFETEQILNEIKKLENRQKETIFQLEEINEILMDDGGESKQLTETLIALADYIENLYLFAQSEPDSALFKQAEMMWNAAKKSLKESEIEVIGGEGEPINFHLHTPLQTDFCENTADGFILSVLESGYIYKDKIIKRASVVVNKRGTDL